MSHMDRALSLASRSLGTVSPNPSVGAVVVKDGVAVGEGNTQLPGREHAEIVALQQAGASAEGATLYTTLEPCNHQGRTPLSGQAQSLVPVRGRKDAVPFLAQVQGHQVANVGLVVHDQDWAGWGDQHVLLTTCH